MDVGPVPSLASAAGAPLAQTAGPEADRAQGEAAVNQRGQHYDLKADRAAGIGQTDGDQHTAEERYGDGRQPWKMPPTGQTPPAADDDQSTRKAPAPRDPSGASGRLIDLSG